MSPGIPDRWLAYKACGDVILGTRIICFKVPLSKTIKMKKDVEPWTIKKLLQSIPTLGAVIDLTNTNKYYSPIELQRKGILYKKIFMPGRIIPPENKVTEFMDTVDSFLQMNDEFLIGVHCTHGLNRTGYMVCRYMRDRLGISAQEAIEEFQNARGYAIERQNYIADILGENPPPPDVGDCSTIVRPIDESPVVYRSKSKKSKKKSYNNIPNDKNYYESKKSKTKVKRRHKSNQSYSNRSSNDYNFKYDY